MKSHWPGFWPKKSSVILSRQGEGSTTLWGCPYTHLGGGGSAKMWCYYMRLFSKMGDKGEGGVKNFKKWVTSFMDGHIKWKPSPPLHYFTPSCVLVILSLVKTTCHAIIRKVCTLFPKLLLIVIALCFLHVVFSFWRTQEYHIFSALYKGLLPQ